jgi:hypothetical protein
MPARSFEFFFNARKRAMIERARAAESEQARIEALKLEHASLRGEIASRVYAHDPRLRKGNTLVLDLPSGGSSLAALPPVRVESYRRHLCTIVERSWSDGAPPDSPDSLPVSNENDVSSGADDKAHTSERICATCKGGCCVSGGSNAFLGVETVKRVRRLHPEWSRDRLLGEYLSRLPVETVAGSCVNHSASGCALPREMRSDTCNDFFCDSQHRYRDRVDEATPLQAVVAIQRQCSYPDRHRAGVDRDIIRVLILDAEGERELPQN